MPQVSRGQGLGPAKSRPAKCHVRIHHVIVHLAMGQNPNLTPSEHPNPHQNRLKWVVHLPQNGIPLVLTHSHVPQRKKMSPGRAPGKRRTWRGARSSPATSAPPGDSLAHGASHWRLAASLARPPEFPSPGSRAPVHDGSPGSGWTSSCARKEGGAAGGDEAATANFVPSPLNARHKPKAPHSRPHGNNRQNQLWMFKCWRLPFPLH